MGLLSVIRKIRRNEEMRILMVGLDNSGKTTIVLEINGEDTIVISPTLGFNIKTTLTLGMGILTASTWLIQDIASRIYVLD